MIQGAIPWQKDSVPALTWAVVHSEALPAPASRSSKTDLKSFTSAVTFLLLWFLGEPRKTNNLWIQVLHCWTTQKDRICPPCIGYLYQKLLLVSFISRWINNDLAAVRAQNLACNPGLRGLPILLWLLEPVVKAESKQWVIPLTAEELYSLFTSLCGLCAVWRQPPSPINHLTCSSSAQLRTAQSTDLVQKNLSLSALLVQPRPLYLPHVPYPAS